MDRILGKDTTVIILYILFIPVFALGLTINSD